ncbi:hypothetical protein [Neorhizobium alkalisoli]|uniref:hypothetical protein n=1 Tax=Neorhizobium alkalisoli TaxID=528178 RepID=UPI0011A0D9EE|nr:hypothetical protein [Neorhizobium alkalisoli]
MADHAAVRCLRKKELGEAPQNGKSICAISGSRSGKEKTGGRIATPKETKEWISGKSLDVAEFMYGVMNDESQPVKERIKAAAWLGEMSMAKAPTQQEINVNHSHTIANMLASVNMDRLENSKTIDLVAVEIEDNV